MAIAYVGSSTTSGMDTSATVGNPSTSVNDIIFLFVTVEENTDITWESGFTEVAKQPDETVGGTLACAWKRATGSEPTSYSPSWSSNAVYTCQAIAFSGGLQSGDIIDGYSSAQGSYDNSKALVSGDVTSVSTSMYVASASANSKSATSKLGRIFDNNVTVSFTSVQQDGPPLLVTAYASASPGTAEASIITKIDDAYGCIMLVEFKYQASSFSYTPIAVNAVSCS